MSAPSSPGPGEGTPILPEGALSSPSVGRNRDAILAVLARVLPQQGLVLEVASGTGEHVAHFAAALPGLEWQPTDPDEERRGSIAAWTAGLPNVHAPLMLDAAAASWPVRQADAVLCINMIHIAPWAATEGLVRGAARLGAPLVLYGPFRRGGLHTAPSNAEFDESLQARDPAWGVRDLDEVAALAAATGFAAPHVTPMPANNLCVVLARPK